MSSKSILAGAVMAAIVGSASAAPVTDSTTTEKATQANTISGVMGNMVQTINSPECSHPIVPHFSASSENA